VKASNPRNMHTVFIGNHEGKDRSLGRPNRKWEDNIKMYIRKK
jgi:hypothetical protein